MSSFLGTRITKHEVKVVEEELKAQRKDYDEYDLYVYYKKVVEADKKRKKRKTEKKEKEKEKERGKEKNRNQNNNKKKQNEKARNTEEDTDDEDDEEGNEEGFQPCHFLSSIYKKSKIKKKGISDYIDNKDNIYEDIIVSPIFQKPENLVDDSSFTFFNESVGYSLLRNCGYTDGVPLGVNINELHFLKKYIAKGRYEKSSSDNKNDGFLFKEEVECSSTEDRKNTSSKIMGPQLPQLYEEIRWKYKKEIDECEFESSDVENAYVHILARKNKIIFDKLKEAKCYEKKIEELYKPKNNFEGAFYVKKKNNNNNNNISALWVPEQFVEKIKMYDNYSDKGGKDNREIFRNSICEPYFSDEEKITKLHRENKNKLFYKKGYGDIVENEGAFYSRELSASNDSTNLSESVEFVEPKKKNRNCFTVDNFSTNEKKREMEHYMSFYSSIERKLNNEDPNSGNWNRTNALLYYEYFKLKRAAHLNERKQDLISLYVPQKTWVTFNNDESKIATNEIPELKRRIHFNNNFKKRNRFFFYCKANEKKIGIQHILNNEE